jgi:isocitrate dehydrogenase kinase/phosphatase
MSGEVWYHVAKNDIFPEEFGTFLLGSPKVRQAFMKHHRDLLTQEFWHQTRAQILNGKVQDFFPYPEELRFRNAFPVNKGSTA